MNRIVFLIVASLVICSCYRTENGLVLGLPDYEKRSIKVTQADLDILLKADALLKDKTVWSKRADRQCDNSARLSLFCALKEATIEVIGKYVHRQPALQEVRFVIDDNYKNRWKIHRLADFNAHPDTTFRDVKTVIAKAIENVKRKLRIRDPFQADAGKAAQLIGNARAQ
jgi:hypothetical protein